MVDFALHPSWLKNLSSALSKENKEDDFSTPPEVQGSINNKTLTIDDPMEPLSDQ
jgi:hypothetical protein